MVTRVIFTAFYGVTPVSPFGSAAGETSSAFAFGGEDMQKTLLEEEGVEFDSSGRVNLKKYQWRT